MYSWAINEALEVLKKAHQEQNIEAIDPAIEALNKAWEAASQEMYAATGEAEGGAQAGPDAGAAGAAPEGDDVSDVEFEEVEEEKK